MKLVTDKYNARIVGEVVREESDAVTIKLTQSHRCAAVITEAGHIADKARIAGDLLSIRKSDIREALPADYEECGTCGFDHDYEYEHAYNAHMEELITRVQKGFLFHATEEQIRAQLKSESISDDIIEVAIDKGKRLAQVRLNPKDLV